MHHHVFVKDKCPSQRNVYQYAGWTNRSEVCYTTLQGIYNERQVVNYNQLIISRFILPQNLHIHINIERIKKSLKACICRVIEKKLSCKLSKRMYYYTRKRGNHFYQCFMQFYITCISMHKFVVSRSFKIRFCSDLSDH